MSEIAVDCSQGRQGWNCTVAVKDDWSTQRFEVVVSDAELARFAPGATDPSELVRRSFEFLLAREPKESILPAFALSTILRYFPEYEREIVRQMSAGTGGEAAGVRPAGTADASPGPGKSRDVRRPEGR